MSKLSAEAVLSYLQTTEAATAGIEADSELFSSGLLDSVAMMSLIVFIEEQTKSDVRPADVTLENFDSVERIVAYAASLV